MAEDDLERRMGLWEGNEVTTVRVFFALFGAFSIAAVTYSFVVIKALELSFWRFILGLVTDLIIAFALASIVMGVYYVYLFRDEGIVPLKEVLKTVVQVALVVGLFFTILLAVDAMGPYETQLYDDDDPSNKELTSGGLAVMRWTGAMLTAPIGGYGVALRRTSWDDERCPRGCTPSSRASACSRRTRERG